MSDQPNHADPSTASTTPPPIAGASRTTFGPITMDIQAVGDTRIKRIVYPPGMVWSRDIKPLIDTEWCQHAHAGYLVQGTLRFEFPDGCVEELTAPAFVDIAPGHDASIPGEVAAVLVEVDAEGDTIRRLGLNAEHRH